MPTFAEWDAMRKGQVPGHSVPAEDPNANSDQPADTRFKPNLDASWLSDSARYAGSELKGFAGSPVDYVKNLLGLPKAVVSGAGELIKDPSLLLEAPRAAMDVLERPEELGSMLGQSVMGKVTPGVSRVVADKAPGVVGNTVSTVGRGMEATGKSGPVRTLGALGGIAEMLRGDLKGTLLSAVPPALEYGGKLAQKAGDAISGVDIPASLEGLRRRLTPGETYTEPTAADSMRATVDTAKDLRSRGMSRDQANQRAGYDVTSKEKGPVHLPSEMNDFNYEKPIKPVKSHGTPDRFTDVLGPEGPSKGFKMGGVEYSLDETGSHRATYRPEMKSSHANPALEGMELANRLAQDFGLSPEDLDSRISNVLVDNRRMTRGVSPTGVERRLTGDDPLAGTIAERAAKMRSENPNIDADAKKLAELSRRKK